MTRYHRCAYCRRLAREAVVAMEVKLPSGLPWAMFSCINHIAEMHTASDNALGVNNGVMRIYSSSTSHYEKGSEARMVQEWHLQVLRKGVAA